jgi:phosphoribosyl 1,2-cyclic phosphodiesterase
VRPFGQKALARHGAASPQTYHIFMSHVHWDHIMGFPFFTPAYLKGNRLRIYGGHAGLEEALRRQHGAPSFPVDFSALGADIEFVRLDPGREYDVAGLKVRLMLQRHAGDSYGYRFTSAGRT